MKNSRLFFSLFLLFCGLDNYAQEGFQFVNKNRNHTRVYFKLINNLIIVPLNINGKELSFILDSGVSKTILFNISQNDSIGLNNVEKVDLRGLGTGEPVEALLSKKNTLSLKNIRSKNETIYVIVKDYFDLSSKMGITIHGIIGYNLLRDFVVKINYRAKYLEFYNPNTFRYKKCRKCETFPIQFYRKKPFIDVKVQLDTIGQKLTDVKLLIDSGGSDALWFFEHTKPNIVTPNRFFNDILGEGLSGAIFGNRSRVPKIKLGKFEIKRPTASFLDSVSTQNARSFRERNGSIGANILKRFIVWFDYPNNKITLKKNASFKTGFNYNMSGLDIVYDGMQLIKKEDIKSFSDSYNQSVSNANSISYITSFSYQFKPVYKIKNVVPDSPAAKAGIQKGDVIVKLNFKDAHEFKLSEINQKFQEKAGKKIKMVVSRAGEKLKFQFKLEKRI